jgi:prepilin-type N-terminal cleavage/methylation domain-containing protein
VEHRKSAGFTLIELLIVVAIIAIIAAIAIPSLLRARVAANESAVIGDIRTVISSQAAYNSANSGYFEKNFACMTKRGGCIPNSPSNAPSFLDSLIASLNPKAGYSRALTDFGPGPTAPDVNISPTSVTSYYYSATPMNQGTTGVRGFGGDSSGRICYTADGKRPTFLPGQGLMDPTCVDLKQ